MFNKRKIIGIIIILILIFSVSFTYWHVSNQKKDEEGYMNLKEFVEKGLYEKYAFGNTTNYKIVYIKDTPIKIEVIKLPNITYDTPPIWNKPNISIDDVVFYTKITFKSKPEFPLLFIGNRTNDFPIDKDVIFSFSVKEYYLEGYDFTGTLLTIEPLYCHYQIWNYDYLVYTKVFLPFNFTFEIIENNTTVILRITNTTDFFPLPRKWSEVNKIILKNKDGITIKYLSEIKVYDSQEKIIGTIGNTQNMFNDKLIEKGDYLIFDYYSNSLVEFYINNDIFFMEIDL